MLQPRVPAYPVAPSHRLYQIITADPRRPVIIDCGGTFDPYRLYRNAKEAGQNPFLELRRVRVARAFTAYQELTLLLRVALRVPRGSVLYWSHPLDLLNDPDLPKGDSEWLLKRFRAALAHFAREGQAVCIHQSAHRSLPRFLAGIPSLLNTAAEVPHGQERSPLLSSTRPTGIRGSAFSARTSPGGSTGAGSAVRDGTAAGSGRHDAERPRPVAHRYARHAHRAVADGG